jgi:methylthioribose-1-phosphate isomerase
VPHTVITDNAGGHLMQHGLVDIVITGADRVTRSGDAANKIGTYLKALAAYDNDIPFYVALPSSTFDWNIKNGLQEINIEERSSDEVKYIEGLCGNEIKKVLLTPFNSPAVNYGFDVTPARLITGLITERGICNANEQSILNMFTEKK